MIDKIRSGIQRGLVSTSGFTFVEILIVIAIVVLLAALVIPRLLMPKEQVLALEAHEFLNRMRLAQINVRDRGSSPTWLDVVSYHESETPNPNWNILGLKPLPINAPFSYRCNETLGACAATRVGAPGDSKFGGTITIDLESGNFSCSTPYAVVRGSSTDVVCG